MAETFREWLTRQAEGDPDHRMPYASLYGVLSVIPDGDIDVEAWSNGYRTDHDAEASEAFTAALIKAQKVYVIDQLVYAQDPDLIPEHETPSTNGHKPEVEVEPPRKVAGKVGRAVEPALSKTPAVTDEFESTIMPCGFRGKDGLMCGAPSVAGTSRCTKHGGAIGDPDVRRSLLITAYGRMIEGADAAVQALLDVAIDGRSEMARVQAAKELLDRIGMTVDAQHSSLHEPIQSEADRRDEAIASLRESLNDTKARLRLVSIPVHSEVVDAEAS